ncbi:MAG: DEAD/DEAH box helicase [Desulfobacterales bacterium]|nr:DEAD/DEAH box helicase [Desulfobacterales bacterium]
MMVKQKWRGPSRGRGPRGGRFRKKFKPPRIKPGADARLHEVFRAIGRPEPSPFAPDPFQLEALEAIREADCLVTVPTGAGKTWIASEAIGRVLAGGGVSWYASPLKALTNSKYTEFSALFGEENVGVLTGDRKEKPDAPVIVGTTEILRNQLYDAMRAGEKLNADFVILDEAHFLGDRDRGVVWEEIMIYLPTRVPLLLLSATIGNARQIAGWLRSIREKPCVVVQESQRPVPLFPLFFHPSGTLLPLLTPPIPGKKQSLYKKVRKHLANRRPTRLYRPGGLPPFGEILKVLRKHRLLPAIFFLKSRADCDNALMKCEKNAPFDPDRKERISRRIQARAQWQPRVARHRQRHYLEELAVGSHHGGQAPAWKQTLESLMTEGLLEAVFATSTVAAGVNFPARTVVFFNSDRFNGREFLPLSPTEFHQMTGRAGRRGMDRIGFALAVPGKYMDIRLSARLINAPPSPVDSQIRINFSMVLNLLLSHEPDQILGLLARSFAAWQLNAGGKQRGARARVHGALEKDFLRHLDFLKAHGYVTPDGALTRDGQWASRLRVDQPLLIAEGFRRALLPDADPALLAGIIASFVHESDQPGPMENSWVDGEFHGRFRRVRQGLEPFMNRLRKKGFTARPLYPRPAAIIRAWASGVSWEEVCAGALMEEGDLTMLILRTADNLRHIRALAEEFPAAAKTADQAIELLMREPELGGV